MAEEGRCTPEGLPYVSLGTIESLVSENTRDLPDSIDRKTFLDRLGKIKEDNRDLYEHLLEIAKEFDEKFPKQNLGIVYLMGAARVYNVLARQRGVENLEDRECPE